MGTAKIMAVSAWLSEQEQKGKASSVELENIYNCLNKGDELGPLIALVERTGDTTPLEIMAGWSLVENADQDTHS